MYSAGMLGLEYEYWVRADGDGAFRLEGVRPGSNYTLFAWTAGTVRQC